MTRKKCTGTQECELSARAVGHLKDCPQRERSVRDLTQPELDKIYEATQRGETVLVPQPPVVSLDSLLTPAEKERIGDASHGMTVTYDLSPLDTSTRDTFTHEHPRGWGRAAYPEAEQVAPARPWWKFWGRRG